MPRAPNIKKNEAEKLFRKGMKLAEIAKKLGVPEETVHSWKNRGKWGEKDRKKNQCNVVANETETNATLHKKKRGGQPGNKNAKGSSEEAAPLRNKNAEKHGFFPSIFRRIHLILWTNLRKKIRLKFCGRTYSFPIQQFYGHRKLCLSLIKME